MATANTKNFYHKGILEADSLFWSPDYLEPSAWTEHIPFSFWLIENFKPGVIVELGVYNGSSYFSFCQAIERLNLNTKTFAIDTWKGDEHAGFYENDVYERVNAYNEKKYSKFSTLIRSTFDEARQYFSPNTIDLLHIDGLHTYEAVKHDFETWLPVLSDNAIIVFHDVNVRERDFGVFKYWEELNKKYLHFEFDFGFGLGVLALGKTYPLVLQSLFQKNKSSEFYSILRNLFAERGSFFKKIIEFNFLKGKTDHLKHTLEDQEKDNEQLKQKADLLQIQFERAEKEIESLSNQLKIANDNIHRENEAVTQLESQLTGHQGNTVELLKLLSSVQLENNTYKVETSRLEDHSRQQIDMIEKLNHELELARDEIRSKPELNSKLELSEKTISELKGQLSAVSGQLEHSQSTYDNLKKELYQNIQLNKELEKKVFVLQHRINEQQKITQDKISIIENQDKEIKELIAIQKGILGEKTILSDRINLLEKTNNVTIQELNKEILLLAKPVKLMKENSKRGVARISEKIFRGESKISNRFPGLSFHLKKILLFFKWTIQGTRKKYKYKIDFWKYHRYVPYHLIDDYIVIQQSGLFDKEWYLSTYEDVKNDRADPILHYMLHGYYEGRDASLSFSTLRYISYYPDVRRAGANPLLHFLYHGKKEGRKIFEVFRDEKEFPYPISFTSATTIEMPEFKEENTINQITKTMPSAEPDFLQRRFHKKHKRDLTAIKTVAFIAQPEYFDFHYREILEDIYTVRYFSNTFSENLAFFKSLVEFDADINIFFRGELVPEEVLKSLNGLRVNLSSEPFPKIIHNSTIIYTEDSLNRFEFFLKIFNRPYDYIFHYDEISKSFFENQGIELSGYFPFPIATEIIKPVDSIKKWDIFFSGRSTPHRDKFFGPLKRDFNFLHINHGVVGSDLLDFIHQCKISLNIHAENEISWEPRTQFLIAAGSLLVSEPLSPTCPLRPGIDFIEVNDPWKLYETCREIITNYNAYKQIAESGRERIVEVLSSRKNFPNFFNELLEGKYNPASFNRNRLKLEPLKVNLKYNGFQHLLTELLHEHA